MTVLPLGDVKSHLSELFGSGTRLFESVDAGRVALEPVRAEPTQRVTHLTYTVRER
jgi:hypothetical protein